MNSSVCTNDCAGYLEHPFAKIGMLCMIDHVSLPKQVRCEYNERDPFCSYASSNAPISRRRGSIRALCLHLNQATSMVQLSRDPRTFFALAKANDGAGSDLPGYGLCKGHRPSLGPRSGKSLAAKLGGGFRHHSLIIESIDRWNGGANGFTQR